MKKTNSRKRPQGRPRKMTAEKVRRIVDNYFATIEANRKSTALHDKVPTVSGLCLRQSIDRTVLWRWSQEPGGKYSEVAQYARGKLCAFWEPLLLRQGCASGVAFWLRNQGWNDDRKPASAEVEVKPGSEGVKVTFNVVGTDHALDV